MAYLLGYFVADGDMSVNKRGSHYIGFTSTDYELLEKVKKLGGFNQKIGVKKSNNSDQKPAYRIQIGSKKLFNDICRLGFDKRKGKVPLDRVPEPHFRHFVRGCFDGDGNVNFGRYKRSRGFYYILITRFAAGRKKLLEELLILLRRYTQICGGSIYKNSRGYHLNFSVKDSLRLFDYMYEKVPFAQYLERKYNIFRKAIGHWGRSSAG